MFDVKAFLKNPEAIFAKYPEMKDMVGCTQSKNHYGDVFQHTVDVVKYTHNLLDRTNNPYHDIVVTAALFHDVSKPWVKTIEDDGIHFYNHSAKSAEYWTHKVGAALYNDGEISSREYFFVQCLIFHHMDMHYIYKHMDEDILRVDYNHPKLQDLVSILTFLDRADRSAMVKCLIYLFRADMWASNKARSPRQRLALEDDIDKMKYLIGQRIPM